jgi:DNA (cytosine-5)-methyltransferase 1
MLRMLDLFAGIGGFSYAGEKLVGGYETVAFCEYDEHAQKVLRKHWPDTEIIKDIRELADDADRFRGMVDIITGGYPCQPFSTAGQRRGDQDDRHLWPEMLRVIQAVRPRWVIGENVAGHISMGLDTVLSDLEADGYATRPFIVPACGVDAPHRRDRVWLIGRNVADTEGVYAQRQQGRQGQGQFGREGRWKPEPPVGRVANGIPRRVDRLRGLGNAIVPQIAMQIGLTIKAVNDDLV